MGDPRRISTIAAVIACLIGMQLNATVFASEDASAFRAVAKALSQPVSAERARLTIDPESVAAASLGQVYRGRPYRRSSHSTAVAAFTVGAIAAIAGTALLVYANRPECSTNPSAGGCGYGAKVIGTSVLVGGAAGLTIGAITW